MTLNEAVTKFLEHTSATSIHTAGVDPSTDFMHAIMRHFGRDADATTIPSERWSDFLSTTFVEMCFAGEIRAAVVPVIPEVFGSFVAWWSSVEFINANLETMRLGELQIEVLKAVELAGRLADWNRSRRGAFEFPEFLVSFEQGGRSQYDIDDPDEARSVEGYFKIIRIEDLFFEAEELISESVVWPIRLPSEAGVTFECGYVLNLQLVRVEDHWEIADCGIVYPPGTRLEP